MLAFACGALSLNDKEKPAIDFSRTWDCLSSIFMRLTRKEQLKVLRTTWAYDAGIKGRFIERIVLGDDAIRQVGWNWHHGNVPTGLTTKLSCPPSRERIDANIPTEEQKRQTGGSRRRTTAATR